MLLGSVPEKFKILVRRYLNKSNAILQVVKLMHLIHMIMAIGLFIYFSSTFVVHNVTENLAKVWMPLDSQNFIPMNRPPVLNQRWYFHAVLTIQHWVFSNFLIKPSFKLEVSHMKSTLIGCIFFLFGYTLAKKTL